MSSFLVRSRVSWEKSLTPGWEKLEIHGLRAGRQSTRGRSEKGFHRGWGWHEYVRVANMGKTHFPFLSLYSHIFTIYYILGSKGVTPDRNNRNSEINIELDHPQGLKKNLRCQYWCKIEQSCVKGSLQALIKPFLESLSRLEVNNRSIHG